MTKKEVKAIHKKMKELGYVRDAKQVSLVDTGRTKSHEILVPAKTLLGKAVDDSGFKTEFVVIPTLEATNKYRRVFKAIAEGKFDFERKKITE